MKIVAKHKQRFRNRTIERKSLQRKLRFWIFSVLQHIAVTLTVIDSPGIEGLPDNMGAEVFVFVLTLYDFDTIMIVQASNQTPNPGPSSDNRWKCKVLIVSRKNFKSCEDHNFNRDSHCQTKFLKIILSTKMLVLDCKNFKKAGHH